MGTWYVLSCNVELTAGHVGSACAFELPWTLVAHFHDFDLEYLVLLYLRDSSRILC